MIRGSIAGYSRLKEEQFKLQRSGRTRDLLRMKRYVFVIALIEKWRLGLLQIRLEAT